MKLIPPEYTLVQSLTVAQQEYISANRSAFEFSVFNKEEFNTDINALPTRGWSPEYILTSSIPQ